VRFVRNLVASLAFVVDEFMYEVRKVQQHQRRGG
jgi:hypothetical protein